MGNIKFYDSNLWDLQVLENTLALPGWPAENTKRRWKTQSARLDELTSQYIRTAGGINQVANGFFIFYHNVTVSGTVFVKGSNDNWATTPFSQEMTGTLDQYVYISPVDVQYDDFGFFIDDATNPDGYIELGRVWYGLNFEPSTGFSPAAADRINDPSKMLPSTGRQMSIIEREKFRTWNFPFDGISEHSRYQTMIRRAGTSKPFVFNYTPIDYIGADYPNPHINSHYCHLVNYSKKHVAGTWHGINLSIEEES